MTAAPEVEVGDLVDYFGSIDEDHGSRFLVSAVDEDDRLVLTEYSLRLRCLRHVHRSSVERSA